MRTGGDLDWISRVVERILGVVLTPGAGQVSPELRAQLLPDRLGSVEPMRDLTATSVSCPPATVARFKAAARFRPEVLGFASR